MYIQLLADSEVHFPSPEELSVKNHTKIFKTEKADPALKHLMTMLQKGSFESDLQNQWLDRSSNLPRFFYLLETLRKESFLSFTLYDEDGPLGSFIPHKNCQIETKHSELSEDFLQNSTFQLSRFAFIRRKDKFLICESPLSKMFIQILENRFLDILLALSEPTKVQQLQKKLPTVSKECLIKALQFLYQSSFLASDDEKLPTWDFQDALFHTRSRRGRHSDPTATMFRFLDTIPPLPPIKKFPNAKDSDWIPLAKPDIDLLMQKDLPFSYVLETRRSIRTQGQTFISLEQLGEFLYRVARIKGVKEANHYEATRRPYPGGGACYELEIYPLIHQCSGISSGLYYYHPKNHSLLLLTKESQHTNKILYAASASINSKEPSQILFLIAARFGRMNWKYQSMAYATIMKDTGVLMQTMYLVATAMGLAPCSVGNGDSDLFSKITKIPYFEETTVGEFILGSKTT
ncbi:MAG: dehydrogenase [Chlamydiae bacterium CG10_big_fil_rev_8_21_14_0_10_42_34]|nr:MAG: dehydrogenase [Chlamydiae bacterium CG10_big_fil_rev_8_21_14_0_10_42_34]